LLHILKTLILLQNHFWLDVIFDKGKPMKFRIKTMWLHFLALLLMVSVAHAQPAQPAQANFSQPELEQMLAPIALYPDALLSQILMASTYPTEVVEASYWLKANPGLSGAGAVSAAQDQQWDISVKSLLPFPQVLSTMETKQDWTQNLGNAFLGQETQVMDTIQLLRQKAMAAGYLKSDNRVRVVQQDQLIAIELVQPTAVYVPYYNPTVVYGTWWAPAYAPVYWDPWPGYAVAPGYYGWAWAPVATVVVVGVLYGAFNWRHHHVFYGGHMGYWRGHRDFRVGSGRWAHDPRHRREIPYRGASVDRRFGHIARTHNAKFVGRPTIQDIRTGKHKFTPVTGKTRVATPVSGKTLTGPTGKTLHSSASFRTKSGSSTTTGGKTFSGPTGKTLHSSASFRTKSGSSTTTGGKTFSGPTGKTLHSSASFRTKSGSSTTTGGKTFSGTTGNTGIGNKNLNTGNKNLNTGNKNLNTGNKNLNTGKSGGNLRSNASIASNRTIKTGGGTAGGKPVVKNTTHTVKKKPGEK
jgi:hypothetical protein